MTHIIRTSDRGTFKRCRQLWDFSSKIRQNYEPVQSQRALDFGTAIHAGLERYYDPMTWHDKQVKEALCMAAFHDSLPKPGPDADPGRAAEYEEDIMLGIGMLNGYFDWAPTQDRFKPLYVELEFEVPLDLGPQTHTLPDPVVYQGRIDLIVEDEVGGVWIVDHKTAAQFGDTAWLDLDEQCGSYCWAVQEQLGIKVEGVIYSELRKDVSKPPRMLKSGMLSVDKSQNTTYELYLAEINKIGGNRENYREILDHLQAQGNKFFRRTQVHRSQRELSLLGERIALEAIDMLCSPSIYPNPTKFNCNGCSFLAPCLATQDGSDPEFILNANYRKRAT